MATPTGYTRVSPGLYRDAKGGVVKQSQLPTQKPVGGTAPAPSAPAQQNPLDYGTNPYTQAMTEYRGLAGKTDLASQQRRRTLAGQIQAANKAKPAAAFPTGGGLTVTPPADSEPPAGAPPAAQPTEPPAAIAPIGEPPQAPTPTTPLPDIPTDEELFGTDAATAQGQLQEYVDPALLSRIMSGFETAGQFKPTTTMPTEAEAGQFYQNIYSQTLADLNQGVAEMQARRQQEREAQLVNRGIPVGSEAYAREMQALNKQAADEQAQLRNEARNVANVSTSNLMNQAQQRYQTELQTQQQRTQELQGAIGALTPLAGEQLKQAGELTKLGFDRETSIGLARLNLTSEERNTLRSLNQSERESLRGYELGLKKLGLDERQFDEAMKLSLRQQVQAEREFRLKFNQELKNFKWLKDKDKRDFAELVRSNRADEALKRLAIAAQGAGQDPATIEALEKAKTTGRTGGYIASLQEIGRQFNISPDRLAEIATNSLQGGPSGIDYNFNQ